MKNKLGTVALACLLIVYTCRVTGQEFNARDLDDPRSGQAYAMDSLYSYAINGGTFTSNVLLNDIKTRAFRHFLRNYPFAVNEEWIKYNDGYSVVFTAHDSILYHVYYDPTGRFREAFTFYTKDNMPLAIKQSITGRYKNYSVLFASAMNDGMRMIYNVTLTDNDMVKLVECYNGNVDIISQYGVTRR